MNEETSLDFGLRRIWPSVSWPSGRRWSWDSGVEAIPAADGRAGVTVELRWSFRLRVLMVSPSNFG
ncbi:MAG TPA: hypothetical protein VKK81_27080 [Candidatus Binatia bacterium]|nr:hypothetical protein [Candidatus Binatia bacterium]